MKREELIDRIATDLFEGMSELETVFKTKEAMLAGLSQDRVIELFFDTYLPRLKPKAISVKTSPINKEVEKEFLKELQRAEKERRDQEERERRETVPYPIPYAPYDPPHDPFRNYWLSNSTPSVGYV